MPLDSCAGDPHALAIGVQELARRSGRSREHVARCMRAGLGRSPTDVIGELRIEEAARQLAHSDEPIADIADQLGFASRAWFYRVFRDRYACSPGEYRRQSRVAAG